MNIFILDTDPMTAAQMMCDKHIPKMIVETYQMLGSALRRHGAVDEDMPLTKEGKPLKGGYRHHPCTRWVGDSFGNYQWAWKQGVWLCHEFALRYGKQHFCEPGLHKLYASHMDVYFSEFPRKALTPFAVCMPDAYKELRGGVVDPVASYRNYYILNKPFADWSRCTHGQPHWYRKVHAV